MKLLSCIKPLPAIVARLKSEFALTDVGAQNPPGAEAAKLAAESGAEAILISSGQKFGAAEVAALPSSVRVVATCTVGYDHLDVAAFNKRGIFVTNTPDVLTEATADLGFLLLLSSSRRMKAAQQLVDAGWNKKMGMSDMLGVDLRGKTLGIFGMGRIGQAFADRARAFGMRIQYSNRHRLAPEFEKDAKYFATLHEMLPTCDAVSLNAPGTKETENIMSTKEFTMMKKGSLFVNVARGGLVDEAALIAALRSEHLFAAGLDVCRNEPSPSAELLKSPNLILLPHIGSATVETRTAMAERALENILTALKGEKPRDALTAH